jgi:hypothetical protein
VGEGKDVFRLGLLSFRDGMDLNIAKLVYQPLLRLIGSGKHIWADEHADEYVENLRRENI